MQTIGVLVRGLDFKEALVYPSCFVLASAQDEMATLNARTATGDVEHAKVLAMSLSCIIFSRRTSGNISR